MISKEELEKLYLQEEMTIKEISDISGISVGTVFNYLKKYGIKTRPAMSEKTKQKISDSLIGRKSVRKGYKLSDETKRKISESRKGQLKKPSKFGGHRKKRSDGYIAVYVPNHPNCSADGYVMEHILVMENHIGRYLEKDEVVHHKNKIRDDNRIENLELLTFKEHAKLHLQERRKNNQLKYHHVMVINKTTGEIFNSVKSAAEKYKVAATDISRACKKGIKSKGCLWEYYKEV